LLVPIADVRPDCLYYFFLGLADLRAQIREAKAASPAAARRHLHYPESGALAGNKDALRIAGMTDLDLARKRLSSSGFP